MKVRLLADDRGDNENRSKIFLMPVALIRPLQIQNLLFGLGIGWMLYIS